jgi:SAM-dependent methyltransferase
MTGFDAAADRYDADEEHNPVLAHMRARSFRRLCEAFPEGAKLLELGSGTGSESARLVSERGACVALSDVAPRLLGRAAAKVSAARVGALLGAHRLRASDVGSLEAVYGSEFFDGALSSFGPLNCEPDLRPVARGLAGLVRPGGALVFSIINRWCPMEVAWYALHGEWRTAARRWGGPIQAAAYPGGPKDVTTWYYTRADVESAFAPDFRVEHVEALPVLWPPPYLDFLVTRHERLFRALEPFELWAARQPIARELGDHLLVRLRRVQKGATRPSPAHALPGDAKAR